MRRVVSLIVLVGDSLTPVCGSPSWVGPPWESDPINTRMCYFINVPVGSKVGPP